MSRPRRLPGPGWPAALPRGWMLSLILSLCAPMTAAPPDSRSDPEHDPEHVLLLHGLCRTSRSMRPLQLALSQAGYEVHNLDYPSRTASIAQLGEELLSAALSEARARGATRIHFVTHSMGGLLVRSHLRRHSVPELGHVVMLGPPNQGSEVVDRLGGWRLFHWINGPAGRELGTRPDSTAHALGPARFSLGIIAGNRSINWINSLLIHGPDDGKVSVERTKLAGMRDHVVVPGAHPFLMRHPEAVRQTIHFLQHGRFAAPAGASAGPPDP